MSTNRLNNASMYRNINKIIGIASILIGIFTLIFFMYVLIEDLFFPGVMRITGFASDIHLSTWGYSGLLIYGGFQILKQRPKSIFIYQLTFIGLIVEFISYKLILGFTLIPTPFILIVYVGMLIYFYLPKVRNAAGGQRDTKWQKTLGLQLLINIGIVGIAVVYCLIKFKTYNM